MRSDDGPCRPPTTHPIRNQDPRPTDPKPVHAPLPLAQKSRIIIVCITIRALVSCCGCPPGDPRPPAAVAAAGAATAAVRARAGCAGSAGPLLLDPVTRGGASSGASPPSSSSEAWEEAMDEVEPARWSGRGKKGRPLKAVCAPAPVGAGGRMVGGVTTSAEGPAADRLPLRAGCCSGNCDMADRLIDRGAAAAAAIDDGAATAAAAAAAAA